MFDVRKAPLVRLCLATTLATLITACSGGSSGSVAPTSGSGDFLVKDAPVTDLVSFEVTVTELRLLRVGGGTTANLLGGSVRVELLGLQESGDWLSSASIPEGTYRGVRLMVDGASLEARAKDGTDVPVTAAATSMDLLFASPVQIASLADYRRVLLDVDLSSSLEGDLLGLTFTPQGNVDVAGGGVAQAIDEFRGVVVTSTEAAGLVIVDAFVDDDLSISLGQVSVDLSAGVQLVQDDGTLFADEASFFAVLTNGMTLLEIHGELGMGGVVDANRIEVEDQNAGANVAGEIKIEGVVASTSAGSFDLMIMEIEKGSDLAQPVLDSFGDPGTITVSHDGSTVFYREDGTPAAAADLAVAQKVKVIFQTFVSSPYPASGVRVHDRPAAEAVITDVTGLPGSVVVHIDDDEPWVTSGEVASDVTDITVDLSATDVFLDTHERPMLTAADLLVGLEVKVQGDLAGTTVSATRLKVRAGRLRGTVSATAPPMNFTVTLDQFKDPFGDTVDEVGPYTVVIDPAAVWDKDAASAAEFMALFAGLQPGETLDVQVEGIGSGNANEILAFEIEAEVQ